MAFSRHSTSNSISCSVVGGLSHGSPPTALVISNILDVTTRTRSADVASSSSSSSSSPSSGCWIILVVVVAASTASEVCGFSLAFCIASRSVFSTIRRPVTRAPSSCSFARGDSRSWECCFLTTASSSSPFGNMLV